MTPNELAAALSDEAMLASKRAVVLRALPYRGKAAILRDTVADELDRQSVRLMRMLAMALPEDPIAEPARDVESLSTTYIQTVPDKCDRIIWRGNYYHLPTGAHAKPIAQPQRQGPALVDSTVARHVADKAHGTRYGVDWAYHDDTRGLLSEREAFPEPQRQGRAVAEQANEYGEPEVIYLQLHGDGLRNETKPDDYKNGDVTWCWHRIYGQDVKYIRADIYTKQPASAAVAADFESWFQKNWPNTQQRFLEGQAAASSARVIAKDAWDCAAVLAVLAGAAADRANLRKLVALVEDIMQGEEDFDRLSEVRDALTAMLVASPGKVESAAVGDRKDDRQRAQSILADEYRRAGFFGAADDACSDTPSPHCEVTISAIVKALAAAPDRSEVP